jgi:sulfur relay (sulfurtransferase) complex TusBCD TusD component (DsrE family)
MKLLPRLLLAFAVLLGLQASPATAGDTDPLFINLTTDDPHRVTMALSFGKNQLERGHPLTVFLNDRAVLVGSRTHAAKFAEQQKTLSDIAGKGANVLICPMCMKHYSVKDSEILAGVKVGNPEATGSALFKDNTKTLTW